MLELERLNEFNIPRRFKPTDFGQTHSYQLHNFSDVSEFRYGVVSFLRLVGAAEVVHCTLLLSKARVAPLKKITMPRLELSAATLAVRVDYMLLKHRL